METKPVIGVLGAGKLGSVLAQLCVEAGYTTYVAGSGAVEKIALTVQILMPGAIAITAMEVIAKSDIIILALPLGRYRSLRPETFTGKTVIDAMNYWWEVDGPIPELEAAASSSEMVQHYLQNQWRYRVVCM